MLTPEEASGATRVADEVLQLYKEDRAKYLRRRARVATSEYGIHKYKQYKERVERERVLKLLIEEETRRRAIALEEAKERKAQLEKQCEQIDALRAEWSVHFDAMKPHIHKFAVGDGMEQNGHAFATALCEALRVSCLPLISASVSVDRRIQVLRGGTLAESSADLHNSHKTNEYTYSHALAYARTCQSKASHNMIERHAESLLLSHTIPVVINMVLEKYGKDGQARGVLCNMVERHLRSIHQPTDSFQQLHLPTRKVSRPFRVPKLKHWLTLIGLSTAGTKLDLVLRLQEFYCISDI